MKALIIILLAISLSGCITATYQHSADSETFELTSFMKSVDGLDVRRQDFQLKADKTHSVDPSEMLLNMMKAMSLMTPIQGG